MKLNFSCDKMKGIGGQKITRSSWPGKCGKCWCFVHFERNLGRFFPIFLSVHSLIVSRPPARGSKVAVHCFLHLP